MRLSVDEAHSEKEECLSTQMRVSLQWPICFYSLESQKSTISTQPHVEIAKLKREEEEIKRAGKGRCSPSLEVQISGDETENKK